MTALSSDGPRLTRRAALAGSVGAVVGLLAACRSVDDDPPPTVSSSGSPPPTQTANPTVTGPASEALEAVTATRLFVQGVGSEFPKLRPRVTRLANLHLAHEELLHALIGSTPSSASDTPSQMTDTRAEVEAAITAAESRLATTLTELAVSAQDGVLARALASMSAGTSQAATSAGWPGEHGTTHPLPESVTLNADEMLAVQEVLEREHAGLWWYGVLGGRTSAAEQPNLFVPLTAGYEAHRRQRDQLTALLSNQGVTPVQAEPAYPINWNLRSRTRNVQEVHRIEHESAAAYSWFVAQTNGDLRKWAAEALRNAAIRDLAAQGTPENFPGADELADH